MAEILARVCWARCRFVAPRAHVKVMDPLVIGLTFRGGFTCLAFWLIFCTGSIQHANTNEGAETVKRQYNTRFSSLYTSVVSIVDIGGTIHSRNLGSIPIVRSQDSQAGSND